jgi:hypothetical protein
MKAERGITLRPDTPVSKAGLSVRAELLIKEVLNLRFEKLTIQDLADMGREAFPNFGWRSYTELEAIFEEAGIPADESKRKISRMQYEKAVETIKQYATQLQEELEEAEKVAEDYSFLTLPQKGDFIEITNVRGPSEKIKVGHRYRVLWARRHKSERYGKTALIQLDNRFLLKAHLYDFKIVPNP